MIRGGTFAFLIGINRAGGSIPEGIRCIVVMFHAATTRRERSALMPMPTFPSVSAAGFFRPDEISSQPRPPCQTYEDCLLECARAPARTTAPVAAGAGSAVKPSRARSERDQVSAMLLVCGRDTVDPFRFRVFAFLVRSLDGEEHVCGFGRREVVLWR